MGGGVVKTERSVVSTGPKLDHNNKLVIHYNMAARKAIRWPQWPVRMLQISKRYNDLTRI